MGSNVVASHLFSSLAQAGIGKGSSDKIHEYLTKGTIAKLEEKRAIHS